MGAGLSLSADDAEALGLDEGQPTALEIGDIRIELPVRISGSLPSGLAMLPVSLPAVPVVELPAWGKIGAAGRADDGDE